MKKVNIDYIGHIVGLLYKDETEFTGFAYFALNGDDRTFFTGIEFNTNFIETNGFMNNQKRGISESINRLISNGFYKDYRNFY